MIALKKRHQPVIDALLAGKTRAEAAQDAGYGYATVCMIARAAGIEPQKKRCSRPQSATARRQQIILETLANYSIRETADRLGVHYSTIRRIAARNGVMKPRAYHYKAANQAVVSDARDQGLTAAARLHGISRERVRQIVTKHEAATGEHIERGRRDQAVHLTVFPQTVLCGVCRHPTIIKGTAHLIKYSGLCQMCDRRKRQSSRLSYAIVEAAIADRLNSGRAWSQLALDIGYTQQLAHMLTRAAFIQLRRAGRRDEIARLWPKGIPPWLQKFDKPLG